MDRWHFQVFKVDFLMKILVTLDVNCEKFLADSFKMAEERPDRVAINILTDFFQDLSMKMSCRIWFLE